MANALRANESTVRPRERAYARCCRERDGACRSTSQRRAASPTTAGARPAPIRSGYRDRSEQEAEPPGTIRKPRRVRLRRVRVAWVSLLNPTPRGKFRAVKSLFCFFQRLPAPFAGPPPFFFLPHIAPGMLWEFRYSVVTPLNPH